MRRFGAFLGRPDVLRDLHIYGGLLLIALGGWQLSPAVTLVVVGAALVALALIPARRTTP
jgi:hypothetical protein